MSVRFILPAAVFFALCLVVELLINTLFPWRPLSMSPELIPMLLWAGLGFVLFPFLKNILSRLLVYIIFFVYLIGNINSVASYYLYGHHYLTDLTTANFIYIAFSYAFVIGLVIGDKYIADDNQVLAYSELRKEPAITVFAAGVFIFPIIWLADEYLALGYLPILSGASIINDMYELSYGKLYGYGVILAFCALFMWSKQLETGRGKDQLLLSMLLIGGMIFTVLAMVFDGRRVFLLIFIGGLLVFELVRNKGRNIWPMLGKFGLTLVVSYVALLYVRQGGRLISAADAAQTLSKVGVEYRDYAYIVTHLNPGSLQGYSWLGSAIGGFLNWVLLALVGLSKNELVYSGSAYQLSAVFQSNFGIRVGLFAELWLQFGLWGVIIATLTGLFFVWLSRLVYTSSSEVGRILSSIAFGVAIFSFVGQSSAITGYWSLLIYFWFAWWFLDLFSDKNHD